MAIRNSARLGPAARSKLGPPPAGGSGLLGSGWTNSIGSSRATRYRSSSARKPARTSQTTTSVTYGSSPFSTIAADAARPQRGRREGGRSRTSSRGGVSRGRPGTRIRDLGASRANPLDHLLRRRPFRVVLGPQNAAVFSIASRTDLGGVARGAPPRRSGSDPARPRSGRPRRRGPLAGAGSCARSCAQDGARSCACQRVRRGRAMANAIRGDAAAAGTRRPAHPGGRRALRSRVRNDWDAIVVGLGAIGSGAAYWLSRRLGDRVLGLEQFELGHANGAGQDHSRIIRLSLPPPRLRPARPARLRDAGRRSRRRAATRIVTRTGGLDIGPRDGGDHRLGRLHGQRWPPRASRSSTSTRAEIDAPLAAVAPRRRAPRRCSRPTPASPTRTAATPPTGGSPRAHGATLLERTPGRGIRDAGGGEIEVELADGDVHRARRVDPRHRRLDERAARVASTGGCR